MNALLKWLGFGLAGGVLGYAVYKGAQSYKFKTLTAPPSKDAFTRMSAEVPSSAGPWFPEKLISPENGLRQRGHRYMSLVRTGGMATAVVEGYWKGDESTNRLPGTLRVDRVIRATERRPIVPFDLTVPPSATTLNNDYLETTRWQSLHATSVGESPREGKKPKVGATVRYAMRERNSLGNAVIVLEGKVLNEASAYWPKDEGEPDASRVLVGADEIVKSLRGGGEISLPSAFVVPVDNLIGESSFA